MATNGISAFLLETFYKSVKNKQRLEEYEDLNEEEKENVVTLVIGFEDAEMFKVRLLLGILFRCHRFV